MSVLTNVLATIPAPDPLGYPVPTWILQGLSYLTLTLHLSAVHFTVGGALLYLWTRFRKKPGHAEAGRFLGSGLPLGVSYIITLGIPPLLFVQVIYGQLFYSSSVLLGAYWIQVIPAVMIAYGAFYYHKLCRDVRPRFQAPVVAGAVLLLLYVGYIYVNNFTLAMTPDKWAALYTENPGGGILHHGEPTIHPRFMLFVAGAFSVAGLALIWRGTYLIRWGDREGGQRSQSFGFRAFLLSPVLWVIAAIGVCFTRPDDMRAVLADGAAPGVLVVIGLVAGVAVGVLALMAQGRDTLIYPLLASLAMVGVTASMVIVRDLVRMHVLGPIWKSSAVPVNAQWGMLLFFVAVLVVGAALIVALMMKVLPGIAADVRARMTGRLTTNG
jgi:hypothetical protein